jgi:hypothetical protein
MTKLEIKGDWNIIKGKLKQKSFFREKSGKK